jgi:hypothetical protein
MIFKKVAVLIILSCLADGNVCAGDADERIRFGLKKNPGQVFAGNQDGEFSASEKEFTGRTFDPRAQTLLTAAEQFTKTIFNVPQLRLARAITRKDEGDVLIAEWEIVEPFASGSVILRDKPITSAYSFHLTRPGIGAKENLARFLSELLVFAKPPNWLNVITINLGMNDQVIDRFFGEIAYETELLREFSITGLVRGNELFMTVRIGKGFTRNYYPVPPFVPERFPPLTETITSWDFGQIRGEVGRHLKPGDGFSEYRDAILIEELVRRGLSEVQLVELLQHPGLNGLDGRAGVVFEAMKHTGKENLLNRYFEPALAMYERLGPPATEAVESLFRAVAQNCAPNIERNALRLVTSGMFGRAGWIYLSRCSSSEETLRTIEPLTVPEILENDKRFGVMEIRKRLAKNPQ